MKLTKQTLKRIIKEEIMKEIKSFPDQDKVYLKFRMGPREAGLPTGRDYYVEVPDTFIHETRLTDMAPTRRTAGWNGLTEAGKEYFETFERGKFKGLSDNITWKDVDESELPQIIELAHDPVPSVQPAAKEEPKDEDDFTPNKTNS